MADELEQVEAAPVEGETSPESATEGQQEPQEGTDGPKSVQKRIDKAIRAQREAEREREFWKQEALKAKPAPAETRTEAQKVEGEPSENDFETHAEYVKALTKYAVKQASEELTAKQRTEAARTQQQKAVEDYAAREQAFRDATPDFDDVLAEAEDIKISQSLADEIVSSDNGPALKYHLAKNPEEVERLNKLTPLALAREVGKIESRFTSSGSTTPPKVTKAPAPITPVGKASSSSKSSADAASYAEFEARRNAEIAARKR